MYAILYGAPCLKKMSFMLFKSYHCHFYNLMKPLGVTRYVEKARVKTREPVKAVRDSVRGVEPRIGLRA